MRRSGLARYNPVCEMIHKGNVAMTNIEKGEVAPDFTLTDYQGNTVKLSQFKGDKHVVLVFNRGFM
jgi:peroxiredoxin